MVLMIPMINAVTEQEICDSVYYFIVDTDYDYNQTQLDNLGETLNTTEPNYYIDNYDFICYKRGISDKLPAKSIKPIKVVPQTTEEKCEYEVNKYMRDSIPTFHLGVGDIDCNTAKSLSYVFSVEEDDSYYIDGVKIWWIASLIMAILVGLIVKSELNANKMVYSQ